MEDKADGRSGYAAIDSCAGAVETMVTARKRHEAKEIWLFFRSGERWENKMVVYSFLVIGYQLQILNFETLLTVH